MLSSPLLFFSIYFHSLWVDQTLPAYFTQGWGEEQREGDTSKLSKSLTIIRFKFDLI